MKPLTIATIFALIISGCTLKKQVAFTPMRMLVLYAELENPIEVNCDVDSVTATNATVQYNTKNQYYIIPKKMPGKESIVKAWKKGKEIGTATYRIKQIHKPTATLMGYKSGKIPAMQFRVLVGLNPILENFDFDISFFITGFNVTYITKTNSFTEHCGNSAFNQRVLYWVKAAKPGDLFLFSDIKAVRTIAKTDTLNLDNAFYEITE